LPDGSRAVELSIMLVPPFKEYSTEIREAIEEIKREDTT